MTDPNPPTHKARSDRKPHSRDENPLSKGREILQQRPTFHFAYLLFALLGVILIHDAWVSMRQVERIPYSEFQKLVEEGLVSEVVVQGDIIRGEFTEPQEGKTHFVTNRVDASLAQTLQEKDVVFSTGAADDLARATDIARSMVTQYAMVPELGNATYAENDNLRAVDTITFEKIARGTRLTYDANLALKGIRYAGGMPEQLLDQRVRVPPPQWPVRGSSSEAAYAGDCVGQVSRHRPLEVAAE